ncbi:hypothetical protein SDC9_141630 [bioreactor metagenome]|uniref:Uncharacterized protein n=1 Tax=bioreactor metagenome TaxID=1076179 RepID=A0A645DY75_9ZZZZ
MVADASVFQQRTPSRLFGPRLAEVEVGGQGRRAAQVFQRAPSGTASQQFVGGAACETVAGPVQNRFECSVREKFLQLRGGFRFCLPPIPENACGIAPDGPIRLQPFPGSFGRHRQAFHLGLCQPGLNFQIFRGARGGQLALPVVSAGILAPDEELAPRKPRRGSVDHSAAIPVDCCFIFPLSAGNVEKDIFGGRVIGRIGAVVSFRVRQ